MIPVKVVILKLQVNLSCLHSNQCLNGHIITQKYMNSQDVNKGKQICLYSLMCR